MDDVNSHKSDKTLSNSSIGLIDAETFDFNLSISPGSRKSGNATQEEDDFVANFERDDNDDDEVYLGPVSFKEQCIATRVELVEKRELNPHGSLLTAEQYVELFKEANSIALQLRDGQEKESSVKAAVISLPVPIDEVELDIAVSQDTEREHKHGGGGGDVRLDPQGRSVIERYKRLTKKTAGSPRRITYKKETKLALVGKASSEGPTRPSKLRCRITMQKRKLEKPTSAEQAKPSKLTAPSGMPLPKTRHSSSGSQDGSQDVFNSSSSSSGSNASVSSLPCVNKSNLAKMPRLSKLRPPNVKQDATGNKKRSLVMQQPTKDIQSADSQQRKIPASKLSLLKPSTLTGRSSGLARPKAAFVTQKVSPILKRKSQPMKATMTMEKVSKPKESQEQSENGIKRSPLRRPSTPCTPIGQDKPSFKRKRILSSASSSSTTGITIRSCSDLDSPTASMGTPARSRRRSCLPTPKKGTPASIQRRSSSISTPSKNQEDTTEPSSLLRRHSSLKLDDHLTPPAKKRTVLRPMQSNILAHSSPSLNASTPDKKQLKVTVLKVAEEASTSPAMGTVHTVLRPMQSNIMAHSSPSLNASTPDLKPLKVTVLKVADEASTSPAMGTLINFNSLPTKSVMNPFLEPLFISDVKENLIEF